MHPPTQLARRRSAASRTPRAQSTRSQRPQRQWREPPQPLSPWQHVPRLRPGSEGPAPRLPSCCRRSSCPQATAASLRQVSWQQCRGRAWPPCARRAGPPRPRTSRDPEYTTSRACGPTPQCCGGRSAGRRGPRAAECIHRANRPAGSVARSHRHRCRCTPRTQTVRQWRGLRRRGRRGLPSWRCLSRKPPAAARRSKVVFF
mmetsp:Transcript_4243/g.12760  ORF Transcript_4243/g.12760 Transcript_4243/m.12760 type:complete len:202 (+) Transcript_4243:1725-2330(+)